MARIAVIGAGPAGSSFVRFCLAAGVDPGDLVLIDRARFPRPKLCGGALTWRGTQALAELCGHLPGGSTTKSLEFRSALGSFPIAEKGVQWLYDRAHLDALLVQSCIDASVELRQGEAIKQVEPTQDGWFVSFGSGRRERFDWVVGADGARGVVARSAELPGGIVGRLVEAVYEPAGAELDDSKLYFDFDPILDGIPGYAWIFPYPKPGTHGLWKLGVMDGRGVVSGQELRHWTERFAERSGFRLVDKKLSGWPEHYYSPKTQAHRPGLLLTGEAWGIDPLLGEGIAPALEISRYAAGRLKEALDAGTKTIPGYEKRFRSTAEGRNLLYQYRLSNLLYGGQRYRFLRVLFSHRYMQKLAASGTAAYGRLAHYGPKLFGSFAWQVLKEGLPSNAPLPRAS